MQTSYTIDQVASTNGMIADLSDKSISSYINSAAEVKIGCVVTKGASTDEVVHPDAAAEVTDEKLVRGVVINSGDMECQADATGEPGYAEGSVVPVMSKGRVWVKSEGAVSEGTSAVYARVTSDGASNTQLGALSGTSDTTLSAVLPKAKWKSSCAAGGLAILELNL